MFDIAMVAAEAKADTETILQLLCLLVAASCLAPVSNASCSREMVMLGVEYVSPIQTMPPTLAEKITTFRASIIIGVHPHHRSRHPPHPNQELRYVPQRQIVLDHKPLHFWKLTTSMSVVSPP
jgi:hypothetical protein